MKDVVRAWGYSLLNQLRKPQFLIVVGSFVLLVAYGAFTTPRIFPRDAGYYWLLRESFLDFGRHFSFLNFSDPFQLRGYLFPLFLLASELLIDVFTPDRWVDDYVIVVILNSAILLLISYGLVPAIFSRLTGRRSTFTYRFALTSLLAFFLRENLYYPLSDLPAFFFFTIGMLLLVYFFQSSAGWKMAGFAFMAGAALMAVYLIRPAYLLVFFVAALGVVFIPATLQVRWRLSSVVVFLLGGALVLFPQYAINRVNYNLNSPFISGGLYSFQTTVGFLIQRYETRLDLVNDTGEGVQFVDNPAEKLLQRAGYDQPFDPRVFPFVPKETLALQDFLRLFLAYPLDVLVIYFRHALNGLNIIYPSTYISDLYRPDVVLMWINYTVLFSVGLLFDARPLFTRNAFHTGFVFFLWLLPVLTAIPGAVEIRFFLPLHVLLLALFTWMLEDLPGLKLKIEQMGYLRTLALYVFFVLAAFSFSSMMLSLVQDTNLLLTPR